MNFILNTDSYKISHWLMLLPGTEINYSYYESRTGAKYEESVFYGLQYILEKHFCNPITMQDIDEAEELFKYHFGSDKMFNREGWEYIVKNHKGFLPLSIKAVPEGTPVKFSNVLMTVENTDENCAWLTNYAETLLSQVWYPCAIATLSREAKKIFYKYKTLTSEDNNVDFMLQDFGFRGASSQESAALGGSAHLVNFKGTDTIPALMFAKKFYDADLKNLGFSVAATEHSVMTVLGKNGEADIIKHLFEVFPEGILSIVGDSYNIYSFTEKIIGESFKDEILKRNGIMVIRPDSITEKDPTPADMVLSLVNILFEKFGFNFNSKGFKVIASDKVKILYGDGLNIEKIESICRKLYENNISLDVIACFGMGGGLLHKGIDRDMQRFAFKLSAQKRNGIWYEEISKQPLDSSKRSKQGRFKLIKTDKGFNTVPLKEEGVNLLQEIYRNGKMLVRFNFNEIRDKSKL